MSCALLLSLLLARGAPPAHAQPATSMAAVHSSTAPATTTASVLPVHRVTLRLDGVAPRQAFEELTAATGLQFQTVPALWNSVRDKRVTEHADQAPLTTVLRNLCDQADLVLTRGPTRAGAAQLDLAPRRQGIDGSYAGPGCVSGPFLVVCTTISGSSQVELLRGFQSARAQVNLLLMTEPQLAISGVALDAAAATDENGRSLIDDTVAHPRGIVPSAGPVTELRVLLRPVDRDSRKIAVLEGTVLVSVRGSAPGDADRLVSVPFRFTDLPMP